VGVCKWAERRGPRIAPRCNRASLALGRWRSGLPVASAVAVKLDSFVKMLHPQAIESVINPGMTVYMKKPLQDADYELFRAEIEGTKPLQHEQIEPYRKRPAPIPRPRPADDDDDPALLSESEVETHDFLLFSRPGLQSRVLQELQRGQIEPGLELDLHGLTAEYARRVLREFLAECHHRHVRCARIIHGKGYGSQRRQPVLKCKVNYWLRLREDVLAFCSAARRDGGTGAVYVLLRNPNKGKKG
jgi:DNA-nicking Smr family endonuclease